MGEYTDGDAAVADAAVGVGGGRSNAWEKSGSVDACDAGTVVAPGMLPYGLYAEEAGAAAVAVGYPVGRDPYAVEEVGVGRDP